MQSVVASAPKLLDFLGEASLLHFNTLKSILEINGVEFVVNPRLVRGMDYYNLTVFEFTTNRLGSQGTVCAGGRYDYLVEQLGGKPAPAVGWALGVDRILELLKEQGFPMVELELDAYAIISDVSALPVVLKTIEALRSAGISVQMHPSNGDVMGSMKTQFKKADGSKARYALIFGTDEITQNQVTVKALRDGTGSQVSQSLLTVLEWASTLQSTK